jgi:ADP-ribose pyrophosphatase YjhB (NUDIX family)
MRTRACGVVLHAGKILLQRKVHESIWALPGGRVEDGETAESAVAREFTEELGWDVRVGRRLWVFENSFEHAGDRIAQIEHCFLIQVDDPPEVIVPRDQTLVFCWASQADLAGLDFRPQEVMDVVLKVLLP